MVEEYKSNWPLDHFDETMVPTFKDKDVPRVYKMLNNFERLREWLFKDGLSIESEHKFEVNLYPEESIVYRGSVDHLVRLQDGGIRIIDYKSSQPAWEYKHIPEQLLRYAAMIALEDSIKMSDIDVCLFNLESGNVLKKQYTPENGNKTIERIAHKIMDIRSMDPEDAHGKIGDHCRVLCGYSPICPYYNRRKV